MKQNDDFQQPIFKIKDTRDHLAADRTIMANERTFLSYLRLALTLFIAGVSFIKFFEITVVTAIGWLFLPLALLVAFLGAGRYHRCNRFLRFLKGQQEKWSRGAGK